MPAMDVTSYRGDPIQESMMQLCPFWTCNIVRFGLATLYIYILQQTDRKAIDKAVYKLFPHIKFFLRVRNYRIGGSNECFVTVPANIPLCPVLAMAITDYMDTSADRTYQTAGEAFFFNECLHAGRMRAECSYKSIFKGNPVFV